ncbi:DUF5683 domain-containing protein [Arcticibacter svalbardensis]|nr:DUF5683 domain-containing protein [Arcticibacter svalbardensis]
MMTFTLSVFSQTDTAVVKVDSAMSNPDSKMPKTTVQKDTVVSVKGKGLGSGKASVVKDSARLAIERMPGQAARRSAIIPGWGQFNNKRWWKVPFIYGGLVGAGLVFEFNQRYYKDILTELQYRELRSEDQPETQNPLYANLDKAALLSGRDYYRRSRDLSVLAGLGVYAINIIDAYVDAKFFRWDLSDELAIKIKPSLQSFPINASLVPVPGIKICFAL